MQITAFSCSLSWPKRQSGNQNTMKNTMAIQKCKKPYQNTKKNFSLIPLGQEKIVGCCSKKKFSKGGKLYYWKCSSWSNLEKKNFSDQSKFRKPIFLGSKVPILAVSLSHHPLGPITGQDSTTIPKVASCSTPGHLMGPLPENRLQPVIFAVNRKIRRILKYINLT